ncbi:MAG: TetR family transcriptional regulator [Solirubrobacterales bacterium]|nr:TetR family transcriptional regulator [Solirubrobacterales bacterium]
MTPGATPDRLRRLPQQERSRQKLRRVLDAAEEVLAREGAGAFTTVRVAEAAGISVGSLYRYFPDKEAIVEALAVRYWSDFEDLASAVAAADERDRLEEPMQAIIETLAVGFRAHPGFLALWYGGLRTERVRNATRPARVAFARTLERMLEARWPNSDEAQREIVSRVVVLIGDGLLREAFRIDPEGDPIVIDECHRALEAYIAARLT